MAENLGNLAIVIGATDKTSKAFNNINRNVRNINNQLSTLRNVFIAAFSIREVTRAADEFTNLNNKLLALTGGATEAEEALEEVKRIARESRSDLDAVGDLFGKIAFSTSEMGVSLQDVAAATQTVMNTFVMAGASAIEAANASRQLAQGLASGTLRGDELNSVMEQNTILAQLLADGLGVSKGALRDLGAEGLITAQKILPILIGKVDETTQQIDDMQLTIGQSITLLRNQFTIFLGEGSKLVPINIAIANSIKTIANNLTAFLIPAFTLLTVTTIPLLLGALRGLFAVLARNPFTVITTSIVSAGAALFAFREELGKTLGLIERTELEQLNKEISRLELVVKGQKSGGILGALTKSFADFFGIASGSDAQVALDTLKEIRQNILDGMTGGDSGRGANDVNKFFESFTGAVKNYEDGIGDANSRIQKSFETTFKGIEKVFANFFATGKIGIKDLVNVFISELSKLAAQAATSQLIGFLIGAATAGNSDIATQGDFSRIPATLEGLAKGGTARPGRPYIVGEEGAELFVPGRVGSVISNGSMTANQSQAPINVNFSISALDADGIDDLLIKKKNLLISMMSQAMNQKGKTGLI